MLGGAEHGTRVALLTGQPVDRRAAPALLDVASGDAGIVVGTHALLQEPVDFFDLGLVVVDEQHRFGVEQRDALRGKGDRAAARPRHDRDPDPADRRDDRVRRPRDVHPARAARRPCADHDPRRARGPPRWMARTWSGSREEVRAGRQVYVVCPRIGDDDVADEETDLRDEATRGERTARPPAARCPAAQERVRRARRTRRGARPRRPAAEVLHGRLHGRGEGRRHGPVPARRRSTSWSSTTVVEVGVDVPNATVMVVLDADRFGVSQLHQLRGRIGRGGHPGLCLLVTGTAPSAGP